MRGNAWAGNGNARRKLTERLRKERRPTCAICGAPIDYSLPAGDPWCFEVDHAVPIARGGDPWSYGNLQATHRICNQCKGKRMPGDARPMEIRRTRLF